MQHFCPKCQKVTEFTLIDSVVRTGDHGFAKQRVAKCSLCSFVPLMTFTEKGEEKDGTERTESN